MSEVTESGKWSRELAEDLKEWLGENSYGYHRAVPLSVYELGRVLGIDSTMWSDIRGGTYVVNDATCYAAIFFVTGIESADPRTIPTSTLGRYAGVKRAMSQVDYKLWEYENGEKLARSYKVFVSGDEIISTEEPVDETVRVLTVDDLDLISDNVAQILVERLSEGKVAAQSPEINASEKDQSMSEVILAFEKMVQAILDAGPEVRDEVYELYGRTIAQLIPVIDVLIQPTREKREKMLELEKYTKETF